MAILSLIVNRAKAAPQLSPGKIEKNIKRTAPKEINIELRYYFENTSFYPIKVKYIKYGIINFENKVFKLEETIYPINKIYKGTKIKFSHKLRVNIPSKICDQQFYFPESTQISLKKYFPKHCLIFLLCYKGISFLKFFYKKEKYYYILEGDNIASFLYKQDYDKIKKFIPKDFLLKKFIKPWFSTYCC